MTDKELAKIIELASRPGARVFVAPDVWVELAAIGTGRLALAGLDIRCWTALHEGAVVVSQHELFPGIECLVDPRMPPDKIALVSDTDAVVESIQPQSMLVRYDRQGQPISEDEYFRLRQDMEYRRIAADFLPDGRWLSTVWSGSDYGIDDQPRIFETMLFGQKDTDFGPWHYATEEQAKAGHAAILAALLKGEEPTVPK